MNAIRYTTQEKASLEVYGRTQNIQADLKNLSVTGACLEWNQDDVRLEKGDLVRMTVNLRGLNRQHNINAEVIWREGNKTGLNFIKAEDVIEKIMQRS